MLAAATSASAAKVSLKADSNSVVVDSSKSADSMILYGVSVGNHHYLTQVRTVATMLKAKRGGGPLAFDAPDGIPMRSVWAAVDPDSGDYTISARPGYPIHRLELPAAALHDGLLSIDCSDLDVLLVRPGVGSWTITVHDGGYGDADRRGNGLLTVDFGRARAVEGNAEPPQLLKDGDVVVAIDRIHMDVFATRIGGAR
jgi:hypothetical protein